MGNVYKNPAYSLRLPQDLKDFLVEKAKDDGRSLNNFIVELLKEFKQNQIDNKSSKL